MMTTQYLLKAFMLIVLISGIFFFSQVMLAEENGEEEETAPAEIVDTEVGPSIGNFWDLTKHAGGFRWLIFLVLIVGIFLISMKIYDLIMDMRKAQQFEKFDLSRMNKDQIIAKISREPDHMLSRLMATLINVFQTSKNAESLHEEIANYVQFQHDRFATFRTRIEFLADTAGALGLLGTVWGMFIVFFSGDLDRQVILTGMGIALLTTLLGLVVSIFLNFFSTVASGIYNKRLDQIIQKSDELRFRLLEFNEVSGDQILQFERSREEDVQQQELTGRGERKQVEPEKQEAIKEDVKKKTTEEKKEIIETKPVPERIELETELGEYTVGEIIKNISIKVIDKDEKPVPDTEIALKLLTGDGIINNNGTGQKLKSDKNGVIKFNWSLGKKVGKQVLEAAAVSDNGKPVIRQIPVSVKPGKPHTIKTKGNNQVGLPGKQLPKPLMIEVYDEHGNPVNECDTNFQVSMGNGTLSSGKNSINVRTDMQGVAKVNFTLDKEPGFNAVTATVKEGNKQSKFQAMGVEENG